MSDDISMKALSGTLAERSRATLAAGCDVVLHCNGTLDEMRAVADAVPAARRRGARRADAALGGAAHARARSMSRRRAKSSPR